jgi:hypothetical protein
MQVQANVETNPKSHLVIIKWYAPLINGPNHNYPCSALKLIIHSHITENSLIHYAKRIPATRGIHHYSILACIKQIVTYYVCLGLVNFSPNLCITEYKHCKLT